MSRLGNSSVTLQHGLVSEKHNCLASEGESVIVCFDYTTQKPVCIPDGIRDAVARIQERVPAP